MKEFVRRTLRAFAAVFTALSLAVTSFAASDIPVTAAAGETPAAMPLSAAEDRLPTGDLVIPEPVEVPTEVADRYTYVPDENAPAPDSGPDGYNTSSSYYYSTMTASEKQLYDIFRTMFEEFYGSDAEPNVSGGTYFVEFYEYGSLGISKDRAKNIALAFYWSEPRFFFLNGGVMFSAQTSGSVTTSKIALSISPEFSTRAKIEQYKSEIESLTEEWMPEILAVSDEAGREELIFKKICDRTMYHYNKQGQAVSENNNQTIAGALVDRECVCNGYAMTMTYFANAAGLDCMLVVSAGHAWNIIKIDGVWYELDVTWTDQDRGSPNSANLVYSWVNKSHTTFVSDSSHIYDTSKVTNGSSSTALIVPNCTSDRTDTVPTYMVTYLSYVGSSYYMSEVKVRAGNNPPFLNFGSSKVVSGYYADKDCTTEYDMTSIVNEDTTIYYTSDDQSDKIIVYPETKCGIYVTPQSIVKGGKVTQPSVTRPGFELEGWYTDFKCTSAFSFSSAVSSAVSLYARWTKSESQVQYYTVTFNSNGGSAVAPQTVVSGKTATEPTAPTKDGFNFEGWYTNTALTAKYDFTMPVTSNFTLYAKWTEKEAFTVTFNSNGGSAVAPQTVVSGKTAAEPTAPTKDGFNFEGWYTNTGLTVKYDFTTPVTSSFTLYAKWTEKEVFTVTFNSNGGSAVAPQTVVSGKTATEPTAPTKDGFNFEGWYTNTGLTVKYDFTTPVTSSFTLYAKWTEKESFTVTFNSNGGSAVSPQTVVSGKTATEPTAPTKDGFNFEGWYTNTALTAKYDFTTPVTSNFTLYAKWTEKSKFTVTFNSNGGSAVSPQTVV
ncbi:MAG: InlB B-repeat-containing protein, partial [Ruminiclostridium sp.]|nr:InlB B-repeat-containing protein [Ruminiclostridium sp.]